MMEGAHLYILRCIDKSLYVGTPRDALEIRIAQHNDGTYGGYTSTRRPVALVYCERFANITDAIAAERLLPLEAFADRLQDRHLPIRPADPPHTLGGERQVLYVVSFRCCHVFVSDPWSRGV